jgi:hypothetical protein
MAAVWVCINSDTDEVNFVTSSCSAARSAVKSWEASSTGLTVHIRSPVVRRRAVADCPGRCEYRTPCGVRDAGAACLAKGQQWPQGGAGCTAAPARGRKPRPACNTRKGRAGGMGDAPPRRAQRRERGEARAVLLRCAGCWTERNPQEASMGNFCLRQRGNFPGLDRYAARLSGGFCYSGVSFSQKVGRITPRVAPACRDFHDSSRVLIDEGIVPAH